MSPEPSLTINEPSVIRAEAQKPDLLDGLIKFHAGPQALQDAIAEHFKLTPNWEAKFNRQFMQWALDSGVVTPAKIKLAAEIWRSDRRFNFMVPTLKGIQEHWLELMNGHGGNGKAKGTQPKELSPEELAEMRKHSAEHLDKLRKEHPEMVKSGLIR